MIRRLHICAALLLVVCLPGVAAAKWTLVRSANFVFIGDASEGRIRRVAQQLEQFREVVGRLVPSSVTTAPAPTLVFVFADRRSFGPYTPRFQGRAVEVAGYFIGGDDLNYIAVDAETETLTAITHEYAHYMTASSGASLPPWASEGLAQVWDGFQERDGGRAAVVGLAQADQVNLLRGSTLIPLRELRAVTHDSPMYNEGSRRTVFYAQSWALMHYLMLGNPEREPQLRRYLVALRTGTDPETAFAEAFGDEALLQRELFDYVRKFTFPAIRYEFDEKIRTAVGRGEPIDDVEVRGYLGDLLARLDRAEDARTHLMATLKTNPGAARALVSLGLLHLRGAKLDEAEARLEEAVSLAPDDTGALAALGRLLVARLDERRNDVQLRERARSLLARAAASERTAASTLAMLASLELREDGDLARATTLLQRAARQAPGREQYRLMLAEALIRQRQFDQATNILGPMLASGSTPDTREMARRLLGAAAQYRNELQRASVSAERALEPTPLTVSTSTPAAVASEDTREAISVPRESVAGGSRSTPRYILDLRPVGAGEMRAAAVLRAIECPPDVVVLVLESAGRALRLGAERFDSIDFISYRSDAPASVSCGPLATPLPVLATYRTEGTVTPDSHGRVVAIELVPDGYTVP